MRKMKMHIYSITRINTLVNSAADNLLTIGVWFSSARGGILRTMTLGFFHQENQSDGIVEDSENNKARFFKIMC